MIHNVEYDKYVCYYTAKDATSGHRFVLEGIPPGRYEVLVRKEGYNNSYTAPFALAEGERLDVGRIELIPCGLLYLEVKDPHGSHILDFEVICDGKNLRTPSGSARSSSA